MSAYGTAVYGTGDYGVGAPLVPPVPVRPTYDPPIVIVDGLDITGDGWTCAPLEGWSNGGASVRRESQPRPSAHGEFGERAWRGGRLVTVTGSFKNYDDHLVVHEAEDRLASLMADGNFSSLSVTEFGRTLTAPLQLAESPQVTWHGAHVFTFGLQLFGPESYRYGATDTATTEFATDPVGAGLTFDLFSPDGVLDYGPPATSLGLVTVTNEGNAEASPVFEVTGPSPSTGFIILDTETGRRLIFLAAIPAGQSVVFDARVGTVTLEGVANRLTETIVEAWPVLGPGETRTFSFEPISSRSAAVLSASLTSTYW